MLQYLTLAHPARFAIVKGSTKGVNPMPHHDPIVLPVDAGSLSEVGKVSGSAIAIVVIGVGCFSMVLPLFVGLWYLLQFFNSLLIGYRFTLNPVRLERNRLRATYKNDRQFQS